MKKKTIVLAALAAVLTLEAAAGSAWAYFTTYTEARGGYPIELEDTTTIREEFSAWTKHVVVASEKDSRPVYVRVKALNGRHTPTPPGNGPLEATAIITTATL